MTLAASWIGHLQQRPDVIETVDELPGVEGHAVGCGQLQPERKTADELGDAAGVVGIDHGSSTVVHPVEQQLDGPAVGTRRVERFDDDVTTSDDVEPDSARGQDTHRVDFGGDPGDEAGHIIGAMLAVVDDQQRRGPPQRGGQGCLHPVARLDVHGRSGEGSDRRGDVGCCQIDPPDPAREAVESGKNPRLLVSIMMG